MTMGRNTVEGEKMMGFVARIEAEAKQKKVHADNISAIYAEAKAQGYSAQGMRNVVKARSLKPSAFREQMDIMDIYFHAAGLADEPPLFRQIEALAGDEMSRDAVIASMEKLVPSNGAIIVELDGKAVRMTRDKDGAVKSVPFDPGAMHQAPAGAGSSPMPARPSAPVPECTPDEARAMGAAAYNDDEPITANPFPFGDKRQPEWDGGWRGAAGHDGMGPND
ncbi:MAG: DUF2312 domain-containing protein [Pseudolabrys sp.]